MPRSLKSRVRASDTQCMIISDEQARLAAQDLKDSARATSLLPTDIDPDFLDRVRAAVQSAPDTREDRVEEAKLRLDDGLDCTEVASKMISRILSDSLR